MDRFGDRLNIVMRLVPVACTVFLLVTGSSGCRPSDGVVPTEFRRGHTELTESEHFQKAFDLLRRLEEFDAEQAMAQVAYHINRWLQEQPKPGDWVADPMLGDNSLGALRRLPSLVRLDKREVSIRDVLYLRENRWLRDLAEWVPDGPVPIDLASWLQDKTKHMPREEAQRLGAAVKLFDWTVRHVQLDALSDWPDSSPQKLPAERAEPGPGYDLYPWECLLLGHGDAWQRARVFMLLLRQVSIPSVLLAVDRPESPFGPVPWAVGVLIGQELYLFDPELGLAIPTGEDQGIATLAEVIRKPDLLRRLDISQSLRYRIQAEDLEHLVALIDASSEALSLRMRLIERQLTGEHRMVLTVDASGLKRQIEGISGITAVRLWRIPLDAELFSQAYQEQRRRDSRLEDQYRAERYMFSGLSPLMQARQLHFRHRFEPWENRPGAVAKYMEVRQPEAQIAKLPTDVDLQRQFGLQQRPGEPVELWQARLAGSQQALRTARYHASYFLGLLHYDNGDYESAANWLRKRTLEDSPESPWRNGARYNLARAEEARGNFQAAREAYLLDESPQRHGNLLRARWIRLHAPASGSSNAETSP
ncbi:MAG: hypothetical protein KatS3mg109_2050 [Pirellulaceae bacterium]|nr:MAG: hypothetical protein KatS3mg109_2050 [Pirellulaceae bacterium]